MRILVSGAAGYIGSVVTEQLVEQGHQVIALDSLVNGHRAAVHPAAEFVQIDLLDAPALKSLFKSKPVDAVVHLAAEALIDVSMRDPALFYRVNFVGGMYLLENYGDFEVGDRVRVKGVLDQACFTICMEGNGCIRSNSISPSQVMPIEAATWSRVKALYTE